MDRELQSSGRPPRYAGAVDFAYYAHPAVLSLTPPFGPLAGGTVVTLAGAAFFGAAPPACRFGVAEPSAALRLSPSTPFLKVRFVSEESHPLLNGKVFSM